MISDEMRELLSTYVDGELRDSDATRVEDMVKRDPELRREVDAYRILRRQLREWDAAEHGEPPPPTLAEKALTRARAYAAFTKEAGRGRLVQLFGHPLLAAAGLLLATAAGLLIAAREQVRSESVAILLPPAAVDAAVEPAPDLSHGETVVRLSELPAFEPDTGPSLRETLEKHLQGYLVDGQVVSEAALRLIRVWEVEKRRDERLLAKGPSARGTDARSPEILAMVGTYEALKVPAGGLVLLTHPEPQHPPAAFAIPARESVAFEPAKEQELVYIDYRSEEPVVVLAGEVLRGERDKSGRTRVVKASSWIASGEGGLVAITWADRIDLPTNAKDLTTQSYMLGPEARRRLVTAEARDEDFVAWLRTAYKARSLSEAFRRAPRERAQGDGLRRRGERQGPGRGALCQPQAHDGLRAAPAARLHGRGGHGESQP
jgi:hypothetical protein